MKMRKILSLIICCILCVSVMPGVVYAESDNEDPAPAVSEPAEPEVAAGTGDATETGDGTETGGGEDTKPQEEPVPEVLKASVKIKGAGLQIKWNKISDAKTYCVYRSYKKASGYKLIKKGIKGASYTDLKTKSGKRAYYKVRALMKDGSYSKYSAVKSGVIYRVYIETGHGRGDDGVWDPGCSWRGYQEAKLMIPICKSMAKHLRKKGVYVYTDAFNGNNLNLNVTLKRVKKYDVSVLVNVHCDYRKAPRGTMPLYRYANQKKLANCLNKGVHKYVKIKNRGLKKRTDLRTLNKTKNDCVACLFETGCISKDNKILRTKYDAYGKGLAKGVCDYLGIKW